MLTVIVTNYNFTYSEFDTFSIYVFPRNNQIESQPDPDKRLDTEDTTAATDSGMDAAEIGHVGAITYFRNYQHSREYAPWHLAAAGGLVQLQQQHDENVINKLLPNAEEEALEYNAVQEEAASPNQNNGDPNAVLTLENSTSEDYEKETATDKGSRIRKPVIIQNGT